MRAIDQLVLSQSLWFYVQPFPNLAVRALSKDRLNLLLLFASLEFIQKICAHLIQVSWIVSERQHTYSADLPFPKEPDHADCLRDILCVPPYSLHMLMCSLERDVNGRTHQNNSSVIEVKFLGSDRDEFKPFFNSLDALSEYLIVPQSLNSSWARKAKIQL